MNHVTLCYGNTAAVIDLQGGQIISFHGENGREVIWQADPTVWDQHAPLLFPVCGSAKNGEVSINGVSYKMPKHGFTRSNPMMQIAAKGQDYVDLVLEDNEETQKVYPFHFAFHVRYSVYKNGFRTEFAVENEDAVTMPMCVGGHPAFICPMEDNAKFEDYDLIFPEIEEGRVRVVTKDGMLNGTEILPFFHGTTMPLNHEEIDKRDSLLFTSLKSRIVHLCNRKTGKGLTVSFPKMEALAVWSPTAKFADFICLEPWHGTPADVHESGAFEDKEFVTMLQPGTTYVTWFDVTLDA
ncbi:MAG: aldose 1-epimerase family protein [Clostridiales bacterium]|nr:aldose 1-epimerase family protein [Clostridiales bacterium]